jgi:putative ABC transport system permease protein
MSPAAVEISWRYFVVLGGLASLAALIAWRGRLGVGRAIATASVRALMQLAAIATVIVLVLRSWGLTVGFTALMLAVASATAARRLRGVRRAWLLFVPLLTGVLPVLAAILATGVVPWTPIAVVPMSGILTGGAMTVTAQTGRRAVDALRRRHGEWEALLATGFSDRDAVLELCRPSAAEALLPALDQTRTVGLVTLPGAFVGVLLGGATPVQAAAAQLLVLIGLLVVETICSLATLELLARRTLDWRTAG